MVVKQGPVTIATSSSWTSSISAAFADSWEDRVTNQEVLPHAALPCIKALIMRSQLRWSGHVMCMEDNRLPKQLFCSELVRGTRKQGRPIKRYKDSLKQSMRACNIPVTGWEALAANRTAWRQYTVSGVRSFEEQ